MAHELRALRRPPIRGPDPSNRLAWRGISVDEDTAECRRFVVTLLYWLDLASTCSHPLQKDQKTLPTCESGLPSWSCLAVGNVWKTVKYDVWSAMQWNVCQALQDIHIYICISTCPHTYIYIHIAVLIRLLRLYSYIYICMYACNIIYTYIHIISVMLICWGLSYLEGTPVRCPWAF